MNATKKITRTEVHAGWCEYEHDYDNEPCSTDNPDLVVDIGDGLSIWPVFYPGSEETRIEVDKAGNKHLTLHEAVQLSDALRTLRARLLGPEDGKGDNPQTRAVTEAFRMGYEAALEDAEGQETARFACTECGQVGQPLRPREVTDEEGVDTRTVWECVDAAGCFGRLREQSEGGQR